MVLELQTSNFIESDIRRITYWITVRLRKRQVISHKMGNRYNEQEEKNAILIIEKSERYAANEGYLESGRKCHDRGKIVTWYPKLGTGRIYSHKKSKERVIR